MTLYQENNEALVVSLLLALALHALIILGVAFEPEDGKRNPPVPTLDIALVPRTNTETPDQAEYLAAHSQSGAGNTRERVEAQMAQEARVRNAPPPEPAPPEPEVLTRTRSDTRIEVADLNTAPARPTPTAAELIERSMELVTLDEQIRQSMQAYAERPRQTFISAATREFKYANYMNDWVNKVERVGNLNYPDEARRRGLSGSLLLDVALNPDGSIHSITVLRPSGHKVLDDAAINIVRLAAPFPPLPDDIRRDTDILHITRTWEFLSSGLSTRR
ncbi:energy transducer TonB [Thiohalobacter sp.]|uniref:energy transducer TonB n=1 Tax=Thiohalobacter sp. TaxID=2025948 RepID=UPI002604A09D|nr:energy transducer TonB [Thiohalobacter sp.]